MTTYHRSIIKVSFANRLNPYCSLVMLALKHIPSLLCDCIYWAKKRQENEKSIKTLHTKIPLPMASSWAFTGLLSCSKESAEFLRGGDGGASCLC